MSISYVYIALGALVLLIIYVIAAYNGLIRGRTQVDEGWADIDVQLKRRYDLIPNLVETVRSYAGHEAQVFEKVSAARSAAMGASGPQAKASAENMLAGTLKSLFAVAEAYPQLRASENFNRLQADLTDTEDKIQAARRFYNGVVRDYNITVAVFPTNIIANLFGFTGREFFEIGEGEASQREAVKVRFG
ncbi:MAG: LemA family protein [Candidatus Sungbacteria bacterium]|nr:LemA family protein [Candidatus Sungbacteria bacterium]